MSQPGHRQLEHLPLGRIRQRVLSQFWLGFAGPWDILTQKQTVCLWGKSCEDLGWYHIARLSHMLSQSQRRDQLPAAFGQILTRCSVVLRCFLKPHWLLSNIPDFSRYQMKRVLIMRSRTLLVSGCMLITTSTLDTRVIQCSLITLHKQSILKCKTQQIPKLKCLSSHLEIVFAQCSWSCASYSAVSISDFTVPHAHWIVWRCWKEFLLISLRLYVSVYIYIYIYVIAEGLSKQYFLLGSPAFIDIVLQPYPVDTVHAPYLKKNIPSYLKKIWTVT